MGMNAHDIAYRAHTPEQKRAIVEHLLAVWEKKPELRFGQLLLNAYPNLYYVEDMDLVEVVERFYAGLHEGGES